MASSHSGKTRGGDAQIYQRDAESPLSPCQQFRTTYACPLINHNRLAITTGRGNESNAVPGLLSRSLALLYSLTRAKRFDVRVISV